MSVIKTTVAKVKNNPVGAIGGAVAAFLIAQKLGKVTNKWYLGAITIAGLIVGANAQSYMKAKASQPTAETVKK